MRNNKVVAASLSQYRLAANANFSLWSTANVQIMNQCSYLFDDLMHCVKLWGSCTHPHFNLHQMNCKWNCDNTRIATVTQEKSPHFSVVSTYINTIIDSCCNMRVLKGFSISQGEISIPSACNAVLRSKGVLGGGKNLTFNLKFKLF